MSSRKRKLSELYYATATFPHPSDAGGHSEPLARLKEAAFLDANDLSKYVFDPYYTAGYALLCWTSAVLIIASIQRPTLRRKYPT